MKIFEDFETFLNEAVTAEKIQAYYSAICKEEGIMELPLKFKNVGFGGAAVTYDSTTIFYYC